MLNQGLNCTDNVLVCFCFSQLHRASHVEMRLSKDAVTACPRLNRLARIGYGRRGRRARSRLLVASAGMSVSMGTSDGRRKRRSPTQEQPATGTQPTRSPAAGHARADPFVFRKEGLGVSLNCTPPAPSACDRGRSP